MTIKGKMIVGLGMVMLITATVMGYLIYNINMTDRHYSDLIANKLWLKDQAQALSTDFINSGYNVRGYLLTGLAEYRESSRKSLQQAYERTVEMNPRTQVLEEQVLLENISGKLAAYDKFVKDLIDLKDAGKMEEAINYNLENMRILNEITFAIDEFVRYEEKMAEEHNVQLSRNVKQVSFISTVIAVLAIIVGLVIVFLLSRSISRPLAMISGKAEIIAGGDLTGGDMEVRGRDELGQLARSFNQMKNSLEEFAGKITEIAGKLADHSSRLAAQAQQTSAGASQTAATTGEIAATVEQVAANTREVARSASEMASHAGTGREGLVQISGEMAGIAASTNKVQEAINDLAGDINSINQFVDMITGIAEQTNLLALNAAIEAARAGEYGRGFSVVAEEVRQLAEESGRSAKEIQQLTARVLNRSNQAVQVIASGADKVAHGTQVIEEVSASLAGIINLTEGLTEQVQSVAAAAQQVSSGVQNMAATAQEQTAAMEEVTAAAENLNRLVLDLENLAGRFKVK